MKKMTFVGIGVALLPIWALTGFQATVPAGPIAIVSSQRLSAESTEGKAAVGRIQALQQQKSAELRAKQQALEATRQQIAQSADPSVLPQLQRQELQQRTDLERAAAQSQADVQALQRQLNGEFQTRVRAALEEVLKGRNVQVVLSADSGVIWAAQGLDLTGEVVARLNAQAAAAGAAK